MRDRQTSMTAGTICRHTAHAAADLVPGPCAGADEGDARAIGLRQVFGMAERGERGLIDINLLMR